MKKGWAIICSVMLTFTMCACEKEKQPASFEVFDYAKSVGVYRVVATNNEYAQKVIISDGEKEAINVYSVAKLFTALAVGMCVDEGLFAVEDKALDVLGITLGEGQDEKWVDVTIEMLLTHTVGFGGSVLDIDVDDVDTYGTDDYLQYVLSQPLVSVPGEAYQYTDGAYYLLSRLVERATGETLYAYLQPLLCEVMCFDTYVWTACPLGHTMGATGLYLGAEDVAKLGLLYAQKGVWKGKRIVSEHWIDVSIARGYSLSELEDGWYCKTGMYGQCVAFNVEEGRAFSCVGYSEDVDFRTILSLLEKEIW